LVTTLRTITSGRASSTMEFSHYTPAPNGIAEEVTNTLNLFPNPCSNLLSVEGCNKNEAIIEFEVDGRQSPTIRILYRVYSGYSMYSG
jgi:hypothetical protein